MPIDIAAARRFLATSGRPLDRRRFELVLGDGTADPTAVLAALQAYRNADGGFGWGLEPDLRSPESQPVGAMHALEVLAEVAAVTPDTVAPDTVAPATGSVAVELCDWLDRHTLADGGLPFTLPVTEPAGCVGVWLGDDHDTASLQMTAQVAGMGHLVGRSVAAVADHPWLTTATRWCCDTVARIDAAPPAHELLFAVRFLDVVAEVDDAAARLLDRLFAFVPADGVVPVAGGAAGEALRPHDLAPRPGSPARERFAAGVVAADLDRLAAGQQPDGGWTVDFESASAAAALEWRGYVTVAAVKELTAARATDE